MYQVNPSLREFRESDQVLTNSNTRLIVDAGVMEGTVLKSLNGVRSEVRDSMRDVVAFVCEVNEVGDEGKISGQRVALNVVSLPEEIIVPGNGHLIGVVRDGSSPFNGHVVYKRDKGGKTMLYLGRHVDVIPAAEPVDEKSVYDAILETHSMATGGRGVLRQEPNQDLWKGLQNWGPREEEVIVSTGRGEGDVGIGVYTSDAVTGGSAYVQ